MPYLIALTGPYAGQAFEIRDGCTTVGRGPACGLVLDRDTAISRAHARLVSAGGVVQVQDAGSTHGVWVNGRRVTRSLLRTGDCVQFGSSSFQLQPVPAQIGEPPRLRMMLPRAVRQPGAAQETTIPVGLGCVWILVALLFPVPFGFWIGGHYARKSHPADRRFAIACVAVSLVSLLAQMALALVVLRHLMGALNPAADFWTEPGM